MRSAACGEYKICKVCPRFPTVIMNDASGTGMCYWAFAVLYCVLKEQAMVIDLRLAYTRWDEWEARAKSFGNRIIRRIG